uniref:(northern house mosquito) hypothetical protein n=1 Tax=Culex pipiens TaxID=7175 RepID=A0A8D8K4X6_CULPI
MLVHFFWFSRLSTYWSYTGPGFRPVNFCIRCRVESYPPFRCKIMRLNLREYDPRLEKFILFPATFFAATVKAFSAVLVSKPSRNFSASAATDSRILRAALYTFSLLCRVIRSSSESCPFFVQKYARHSPCLPSTWLKMFNMS